MDNLDKPLEQNVGINRNITLVLTALKLSGAPYALNHDELMAWFLTNSPTTMLNSCPKMEELGLITITSDSDPHTNKHIIYKLTDEGIVVAKKAMLTFHKIERDVVKVLTEDEQELLAKLFRRLTE